MITAVSKVLRDGATHKKQPASLEIGTWTESVFTLREHLENKYSHERCCPRTR
jgi:hypothetical protein